MVFVVVEEDHVERLSKLDGIKREYGLDEAIVKAVQARIPVDLLAMERWAREHGLFIGLSGKNQILGGKARLTTKGLRTDFEPAKLVARSLLDKPEAFRGGTLTVLVLDDPFVNEVTGEGAFLLKDTAPRTCKLDSWVGIIPEARRINVAEEEHGLTVAWLAWAAPVHRPLRGEGCALLRNVQEAKSCSDWNRASLYLPG